MAAAWWHIPLIPLFPLLAAAMWLVLRGQRGILAWLARIGAYLFACLYTALDTISGIGAGAAAWAFYRFHIFTPYGALSMLGFAVGFALLAAARSPQRDAVPVA